MSRILEIGPELFFKQELWQETTSKLIVGLENSSTHVLEGLNVNIRPVVAFLTKAQ